MNSDKDDEISLSFTDIFNQTLPYYLAIGMPYELFWHGDSNLVNIYAKAHELKMEEDNQRLWAQGLYNLKAFKCIMERFAQGLSGKSGGSIEEYPSEPIPFTETEQKAAIERNKQRTLAWVESGQH